MFLFINTVLTVKVSGGDSLVQRLCLDAVIMSGELW